MVIPILSDYLFNSTFFRMKKSITLIVPTIIIGSSLIITFYRLKASERTIDNLTRIPRRQSNFTILNSKVNPMEFKLGDIPDWISCPPAVILAVKKSNQFNLFARKQLRAFGVWQLQRMRCSIIVFLHYQYRYILIQTVLHLVYSDKALF